MFGSAPLGTTSYSATEGSLTHEGEASLVASASINAIGRQELAAAANLAGQAQVLAQANLHVAGQASILGDATLAAAAHIQRQAASLVVSAGKLTAIGLLIQRTGALLAASSRADVYGVSLFDDLNRNPNRRLVYTIEMEPWLMVPYDEAA